MKPTLRQKPRTGKPFPSLRGTATRRDILKFVSSGALASTIFGRALAALAADKPTVTDEMIRQAQWVAGLDFTEAERRLMRENLEETLSQFEEIRQISLDNAVPPAFRFDPSPAAPPIETEPNAITDAVTHPTMPVFVPEIKGPDDLAFASIAHLSALLQEGKVSSMELTRLSLERLRQANPKLECVISYTEELALRQAEQADREIAQGNYRGPLHGIPWGAKDILAVPGYRTTWGAAPYKDQVRKEKATVVQRLEEAGAVLTAKLSVGALVYGDRWFGGTTKSPWNLEWGSSGSSAGSAAATAAGLVGFAIGTETWGSIIAPCTRCAVTGLRPTFGRVSRHGVMALAWSMDKVGSIARSAEDCALVFSAIHGRDGLDPTAVSRPFHWPSARDAKNLKVGYIPELFEEDRAAKTEKEDRKAAAREWQQADRQTLQTLKEMGIKLIPIKLPDRYPVEALSFILEAEAGTAFDELTRSGRDDMLTRQTKDSWPNIFRRSHLIPAVEYIRAHRIRTLLMQEMEKMMSEVDVYVAPSFGKDMLITNLTGHPAVVVPNGFRLTFKMPTSITFTGRLYGESDLLTLARAYQEATDFHLKRPPSF